MTSYSQISALWISEKFTESIVEESTPMISDTRDVLLQCRNSSHAKRLPLELRIILQAEGHCDFIVDTVSLRKIDFTTWLTLLGRLFSNIKRLGANIVRSVFAQRLVNIVVFFVLECWNNKEFAYLINLDMGLEPLTTQDQRECTLLLNYHRTL